MAPNGKCVRLPILPPCDCPKSPKEACLAKAPHYAWFPSNKNEQFEDAEQQPEMKAERKRCSCVAPEKGECRLVLPPCSCPNYKKECEDKGDLWLPTVRPDQEEQADDSTASKERKRCSCAPPNGVCQPKLVCDCDFEAQCKAAGKQWRVTNKPSQAKRTLDKRCSCVAPNGVCCEPPTCDDAVCADDETPTKVVDADGCPMCDKCVPSIVEMTAGVTIHVTMGVVVAMAALML